MLHKLFGIIILGTILTIGDWSDKKFTEATWKEAYIDCLELEKEWDSRVGDEEKSQFYLHDFNSDGIPELIVAVHRGIEIYTFDRDKQKYKSIYYNANYALYLKPDSSHIVFAGYLGGNQVAAALYEIDKNLNMTEKEYLLTGSNMANYEMYDYYRNGQPISGNEFECIYSDLMEDRIKPEMFIYANEKKKDTFDLENYVYKP